MSEKIKKIETHHFEIAVMDQQLGKGGSSVVHVGKIKGPEGFERIVAIKSLSKDKVEKEFFQKSLIHEAVVQGSLNHANIVTIIGLKMNAETPIIIMEFIEGIDVKHLLRELKRRNTTMGLPLAAYITTEVSKALSYAHIEKHQATGKPLELIHRDVSPGNILLSIGGGVKLSDFGIAKSSLKTTKTQTGYITGTLKYMSPEQASEDPLDYRTDIFSLGLIFYECLFGNSPYPQNVKYLELLKIAARGEIEIPDDTDSELSSILKTLLAPNRKNRYSDLSVFRKEINDFVAKSGRIATGDDLEAYLQELNPKELIESRQFRQRAEEWDPELSATYTALTEEGEFKTVQTKVHARHKWTRPFLVGGAAVIALLIVGIVIIQINKDVSPPSAPEAANTLPTAGTLNIQSDTEKVTVTIEYEDKTISESAPATFPNIPFGVPIKVTAKRDGYQPKTQEVRFSAEKNTELLKINLQKKIEYIHVTFNSEPWANVFIKGEFKKPQLANDLKKRLRTGEYKVIFENPDLGKKATARLNAKEPGSYLCLATMLPRIPAKASCRRR